VWPVARACIGDGPDDDVDDTIEWIEDADGTFTAKVRPSCLDLVGDLAGTFEGPADLSTNPDYLDDALDHVQRD
jgi:hypothetical protein